MGETYSFRREDNGEIVEVDFLAMMEAKDGFLEVEPGVMARRVGRPTERRVTAQVAERKKIVSDAMGFGQHQLAEMEADRAKNGFTDVEFVPDPEIPQFFQVHCGSEKAKRRYMEHRQFTDRNSRNGGGQPLSQKDLEDAKELLLRK